MRVRKSARNAACRCDILSMTIDDFLCGHPVIGRNSRPRQEDAMLEVEKPADLKDHIGQKVGTSEWVTVDQAMIDRFAEATGDHQWIHVDVERAKCEMPGGRTIAHGYLTLSLLPRLSHNILVI